MPIGQVVLRLEPEIVGLLKAIENQYVIISIGTWTVNFYNQSKTLTFVWPDTINCVASNN